MTMREFDTADPRALATLFAVESESQEVWSEQELPALFLHQMEAQLDLGTGAGDVRAARANEALTFVQVLSAPQPAVELLNQVKRQAKLMGRQAESAALRQISGVVYLAAVSAALVRCEVRITRASDAELDVRLRWAASRSWIDAETRGLLEDARALL